MIHMTSNYEVIRLILAFKEASEPQQLNFVIRFWLYNLTAERGKFLNTFGKFFVFFASHNLMFFLIFLEKRTGKATELIEIENFVFFDLT